MHFYMSPALLNQIFQYIVTIYIATPPIDLQYDTLFSQKILNFVSLFLTFFSTSGHPNIHTNLKKFSAISSGACYLFRLGDYYLFIPRHTFRSLVLDV